jgi:paraquat-inducible protein B
VSPDLNQLVTDAAGSMATLNKDLPVLSKDAQKVLEDLAVTLETARKALQRVDYTLSDDSALIYDLRQAASEIGAAGRALQSLAESLDTHPESLIKGKRAQ